MLNSTQTLFEVGLSPEEQTLSKRCSANAGDCEK